MRLFLDFETFYESKKDGYGLRQMSMVEYIRSPKFKAFGAAIATDNGPVEWISAKDLISRFEYVDWSGVELVGHNVKFDGSILLWKYGCYPRQFIDTKGMAKAILGKSVKGHSLALLAEHFGLQSKGIMKTDGKSVLTEAEEKELAGYCINDVELCRSIYTELAKDFPLGEYASLHRTVDMFVYPKLQLNVPLLLKTSQQEALRRENIFKEIGIDKKEFASNKKFPALLAKAGFEVPIKLSPRTNKNIPALALGDPEFLEMLEGENEELRTLCEARVAAKSTLLETRSAKLAKIGATGLWPFDVEFSGADQTHRFSGGSGAGGNPQNFTRGSSLRAAVEAPRGYELIVGDFSNIELRLVAYLSKDPGLVQAIESGVDIYCDFASVFYGRRITKENEKERRFGKCLAEGTLVLTDSGWKRIELVRIEDKLWDGIEWVGHQGLSHNGIKDTIELNGLRLTSNHPILCGTEWKESQSVEQDEKILSLALETGSENLPLQVMSKGCEEEWSHFYERAIADLSKKPSMFLTSKQGERLDVESVLKSLRAMQGNYIGAILEYSKMMNTENGSLTELVLPSVDAIVKRMLLMALTEGEAYSYFQNGELTVVPSSDIYLRSTGGIIRTWKWIVSTIIKGMSLITSVFQREKKTSIIDDNSKISKRKLPVYDLLSAGPRNRFTVLTQKGPLLVHNCSILGLGYGMGWAKFIKTVRVQTGETITEKDSRKAIDLYRTRYSKVPALWENLDNTIGRISGEVNIRFNDLPIVFGGNSIRLPSGLKMRYPNLRQEKCEKGYPEWVYDTYVKRNLEKKKLYGGKLLENICQGLAGELCKEAMLKMGDNVTGLIHDEIHVICKRGLGLMTAQKLKRAMTTVPEWMPQLRLDAEIGIGTNWSNSK